MLQLIGSVISGLLICLGSYLTLMWLDRKREYQFPRKNNYICSVPIFVNMGFTLVIWILYSMIRPAVSVWMYLADMCMICGLAILTVTDWVKHRIPNKVLLVLLMIWAVIAGLLILFLINDGMAFTFSGLAGALVGGIIFFLCYLLSRKQLGAGDVKLVFVLGLYLTGQRIIGAIFYGVIFCCIFSLIQIARKKITVKDGVPLVPFLYLGTVLTLLIL